MAGIVHQQVSGQDLQQEVSVGKQTAAFGPEGNLPGFSEEHPDPVAVVELQVLGYSWLVYWSHQKTGWRLTAGPALEAGPEVEGAAGREDSAEDHLR